LNYRKQAGKVKPLVLKQKLHGKLKAKKDANKIDPVVSLSSLIDRTFEHFKEAEASPVDRDSSPVASGSGVTISSQPVASVTSYGGW